MAIIRLLSPGEDISLSMSVFADTITKQKYAHDKADGTKETWEEIAYRVASNVLKAVNAPKSQIKATAALIEQRKFIPGGRYLYASGRAFHQTQNCYAGETKIVTRYGAKTLEHLSGHTTTLMTSNGHWIDAEVKSFGEQPLMKVELTRSGATKELYATAGHSWRVARNQSLKVAVETSDLKSGDRLSQVFGYGMSRTPISPAGIQHGIVFGDGNVPESEWGFNTATVRLCGAKDAQLLKWFVGYETRPIESDVEVSGLPRHYKQAVSLEADRSYLLGWLAGYFAADGCVSKEGVVTLASADYGNLNLVKDVCYLLGIGACSIRTSDRISNLTNAPSTLYSIALLRETLTEEFFLTSSHRERFLANPAKRNASAWTVVSVETTNRAEEVYCAVVPGTHEFVLEDNILTGNCLLFRAEDSREGWSELMQKQTLGLMTGAGTGTVYSDVRAEGKAIRRTGGQSTGPLALMQMVNEAGRGIMQGGSRRAAIWAGLHWWHPDAHRFIHLKDWSLEVRALKEKDFNFPATMDMTNVSIILDDDFFKAYHNENNAKHSIAYSIYWDVIKQMRKTGEPGFSIDTGVNVKENLRNACTEVTSEDDSDICNLGSINLSRIISSEEMTNVVELSTAFLLAGTVYSDVPFAKVDQIRTKNRRLGLGLMGIHEWLLQRGKKYAPDVELGKLLEIYANSGDVANSYADKWDISHPLKTRAIAPTGSIGIVAETTTGIEPIFCVAYKRRYLKHRIWNYQYVIDPAAERLVAAGVNPENIEDAYSIDEERRINFQAWVQGYVDHAISSTINLPFWGSESNNESTVHEFGDMLLDYLPQLRGITCYPDGARGGQPLSPVKYATAVKHLGKIYQEEGEEYIAPIQIESKLSSAELTDEEAAAPIDICELTKSGTCSS